MCVACILKRVILFPDVYTEPSIDEQYLRETQNLKRLFWVGSCYFCGYNTLRNYEIIPSTVAFVSISRIVKAVLLRCSPNGT